MQLSENLSLAEVIRSETAKRNGISNKPNPRHLENLKIIAGSVTSSPCATFRDRNSI